jgi:hypothetical protein
MKTTRSLLFFGFTHCPVLRYRAGARFEQCEYRREKDETSSEAQKGANVQGPSSSTLSFHYPLALPYIATTPSSDPHERRAPIRTMQVQGCTASVANMKTLNVRYRICDTHAKAPVVMQDGEQMRFCQQCSRLQPVGEFDESKRSCRYKLELIGKRRKSRLESENKV